MDIKITPEAAPALIKALTERCAALEKEVALKEERWAKLHSQYLNVRARLHTQVRPVSELPKDLDPMGLYLWSVNSFEWLQYDPSYMQYDSECFSHFCYLYSPYRDGTENT